MNKKMPTFLPLKTNRDLLLFQFSNSKILVVSCDSSGGIGPKPLDKLKVDGFTLGKFTARVALMEALSVGAEPVCIVDTLSVEPEPTGNDILRGIRNEAKKAGLDPKMAVTGSTEKTFPVEQTGIGVTVIATCKKNQLKIGVSQPKDMIVAVGVPHFGEAVIRAEANGEIADIADVFKLRRLNFVHELVPVGSKGIAYEAGKLAKGSNLKLKIISNLVDVKKHAGPGTVVLATLPESGIAKLKEAVGKPVNVVGQLS